MHQEAHSRFGGRVAAPSGLTDAFFEAAPDAMIVVDRGGVIVAANARAHTLFEHEPGTLVGATMSAFLPPDRLAAHAQHQTEFFSGVRGAMMRTHELLRVQRRNGEPLELEATLSLARVNGLSYAIAAIREVSPRELELRRTREQLARDEAFYRAIAETIPNAVVGVFDREMRIVAVEGSRADQLIHPRERLVGMLVEELADPDRRAFVREACRRCLAGHRVEWFKRRDGQVLDVTFVPMRARDGGIVGGLGLIYDATARERDLLRLTESKSELECVLAALPEPVMIHDGVEVCYANAALARKLGFDRFEDLGDRRLLARIHPDDHHAVRECERWFATDGGAERESFELRFLDRDGGEVPLVCGSARRVTYQGLPMWLEVLHDMREQKRGMLVLAAKERMITVGTLAAGVGHEINNPLTYVLGNLDIIAEEVEALSPSLNADRRAELIELLYEARDGAERIRKIVRGLRTFARGEREERTLIDMRAVVEVALQLSHSALRVVAHVTCDLQPTPPVMADESQLVQVLVNLLINAAHALAPTPMEQNFVRVEVRTDDAGRVMLVVADNGPGMTDAVARRVFEPFFTTKGVGEGTGLGLSIVHNIVTGFGGTVTCETAPGAGATFRVVFPAVR